MAKQFVDVNKEKYMKALFLDIQKQTKMVDLSNKADLIYDFVLNNPSNIDGAQTNGDLNIKNKLILIEPRIKTSKPKKSKK